MLVLGRKINESVRLDLPDGRSITITVCKTDGPYVRLAFDAPPDVRIVSHRDRRREGAMTRYVATFFNGDTYRRQAYSAADDNAARAGAEFYRKLGERLSTIRIRSTGEVVWQATTQEIDT